MLYTLFLHYSTACPRPHMRPRPRLHWGAWHNLDGLELQSSLWTCTSAHCLSNVCLPADTLPPSCLPGMPLERVHPPSQQTRFDIRRWLMSLCVPFADLRRSWPDIAPLELVVLQSRSTLAVHPTHLSRRPFRPRDLRSSSVSAFLAVRFCLALGLAPRMVLLEPGSHRDPLSCLHPPSFSYILASATQLFLGISQFRPLSLQTNTASIHLQ